MPSTFYGRSKEIGTKMGGASPFQNLTLRKKISLVPLVISFLTTHDYCSGSGTVPGQDGVSS